jgi:hypothetical protein
MARCRTASGLPVGMPSSWRVKALRSDGQVVPSSVAAALTLPSCLASWKARSASARSVRNRLGCQPSGRRSCPCPTPLRTRQRAGAVGADIEQSAATAPMRLRPAACAWAALPQHGAWAG